MTRHRTLIRLSAALAGVALVWACGGDSPTVPPTPEPARPTTVTVSPSTAELTALGATVQLSAEVRDQNARVMAGATVTWSSGDTSVATVDASGLVTAVGNGTATITASAGSASGSAVVTVTQAVATVGVSPSTADLTALGATVQLTAEAFDANGHAVAETEFSWESSDAAVATVDASGLVTGVAEGVATITASGGLASGSAVVTVTQPVATVEVSPAAETIALGSTLQLTAEGFDENGDAVESVQFSWESSDVAIATVDASGLVTGVAVGAATITASAGSGQGTAEITVMDPDRAALVALYEATDGPNWVNAENWLTDAPLGDWYGVDTDSSGRVVRLDLAGRWDSDAQEYILHGLSGPIPPELGNLARLESLRLQHNQLSGPIPPELGNLANLEVLDLDRNNLSGPIPPELGRLSSLEVLSIVWNNLSGPIPPELGGLPSLERLSLGRNTFTGSIPSELGNLSNLKTLGLSHGITQPGGLSGPIPPELGNLTNLTWLVLLGNSLSGSIPPELGSLGMLRSLDLRFNGLSGSIPSEFGGLRSVERLLLRANKLTGAIPSSFIGLPLAQLWFDDNPGVCAPGAGVFIDWLQGIEDWQGPLCSAGDRAVLESLYSATGGSGWLDQAGWLDGDALATWHGITVDSLGLVTEIDLAGNGLAGSLVSGLGELAQLTELRIGDNPALSGRMPNSLAELLPLRVLHYDGTDLCVPVEGVFSSWVSQIPSHQGTGVACAAISDREILVEFYQVTGGPSWLQDDGWLSEEPLGAWYGVTTNDAGKVTELSLQNNGLTGPIPPVLRDLANLAHLALSGNHLTGELPRSLGNLSALRNLDLAANQLTGTIPPEFGDLVNLRVLSLRSNFDFLASIPPEFGNLVNLRTLNLTGCFGSGSIPPELGNLVNLEYLYLSRVRFSGSIPPELGRLSNLRVLALANGNLTGSIPEELGGLSSLEQLILNDNGLTGPIPPELGGLISLQQLLLDDNSLTGSIPPELGGLTSLMQLSLGGNELSGAIPPQLGGLTGLEQLFLNDNGLNASIPPELGDLSNVEQLYLGENNLSGPLPPDLGRLARLRELVVTLNPSLSGPLPVSLSNLGSLEALQAGGTDLCAPSDAGFLQWLEAIPNRRVALCRDAPVLAYLTQAAQSREFAVPLVAGEEALLRVFPTASRANAERIPRVRASFHLDGALVHVADIPGKAGPIPTEVDESSLVRSANVLIPAEVVGPGLELVVEIDPDGTVDAGLGVVRRIPETDRLALDVRDMPLFELTLIPFLWAEDPDSSILAPIAAMAADPENHELLQDTRSLLPVGQLTVHAHEPVMTSGPRFRVLDPQTAAIRVMEGGSGHYMGMMSPESLGYTGGGNAELGGWSSWAAMESDVIAHELGHNMSLRHAPCGGTTGLDPAYPYPYASTGVWGYDFRDEGRLVSPNLYRDLMSYCGPEWVSDYNFDKALRFRLAARGGAAAASNASANKSLLLWGSTDSTGTPFLEPAFVVDAPPNLPPRLAGEYEITGRTAAGDELFSLRFDLPETADGDGSSSFAFVLPVRPGWEGNLAGITLAGPGGSFTLDGESDHPMTILRNPSTGQVRGILRDLSQADAAAALAPQAGPDSPDVLFSRGIPDAAAWSR